MEEYERTELTVTSFDTEDVITTSGPSFNLRGDTYEGGENRERLFYRFD